MQQVVSARVGTTASGLAAVFGVELLLDRGEEAVEVDVQEAEAVGMGGSWTREFVGQLYSLFICLRSGRR